jgi:small subunit ribosomal protein S1
MDEKPNPAAETPVPATDHSSEDNPSQAPSATADQGVGVVDVDVSTSDSSETNGAPSGAETPDATEVVEAAVAAAETVSDDVAAATAPMSEAADAVIESAEAQADAATEGAGDAVAAAPEVVTDAAAQIADAVSEAAETVPEGAAPTESDPAPVGTVDLSGAAAGAAVAVAATSASDDSGEGMTMEDVLAASDEQLARKPVHRGMIANGEVIMLSQEGIIVDVGAKIEGMLPYNQLFEFEATAETAAKYFKPGDQIQVYVVRSDVPNNTIILSKKRADQERAWNLLQEIHEKETPVEVEIVEKVKGGLVANLGVRAFLPASQVDIRRVSDLSPYVDQRLKVKIIELNRRRNRVIISRRAILELEVAGLKEETLKKLEPGLRTEGEVVEITDFGAFVNLGGIDGLVHRSELTHGRFNHPRDVVKLGQKVTVEVLDMDLERERINLSMKKLIADPWANVLNNYSIGQRIGGQVTNLTQFGAFVEIEPGLEGLIHVSEMSWTKRVRHPKEIVTEGDEVEAMILKIDTSQQRISLGLRQTQPDPWSSLPDRFPPGTEVTGPITGITDFGVFMEIEEGIEGLVHISELAHEHIDDISEHFARGDEVTAVILNIDPVEQRASLSRKRLLPFNAQSYTEGGAPATPRGVGGRKGRRGRRGDIDYDYSYAASESSSKPTTKLGDVYADLFAQFGLAEGQPGESADGGEAAAEAATESADAAADTATEATAEVADTAAEATPEVEAAVEQATDAAEATAEVAEAVAENEAEPEDLIDAAEAAALLTAAFREGKRPQAEIDAEAAAEAQVAAAAGAEPVEVEIEADAETDEDDDENVNV